MRSLIVFPLILTGCSMAEHRACSSDVEPRFVFGHASDTHIGYGRQYQTERAIHFLNKHAPAFTIFTGDLANDVDTDPVLGERQLDQFLNLVSELNAPAYFVPGNHDVGHVNVAGSIRANNEAMFISKVGPLDQDFEYEGMRFVLVNNNYMNAGSHPMEIAQWQFDWIENVLTENKPTIVFGHIHAVQDDRLYGKDARRLHSLLDQYPRAIGYFHGHLHTGTFSFISDLIYFGAPAVLGRIKFRGNTGIGPGQVVIHRVFDNHIEGCMIPLDGTQPYQIFKRGLN